MSKKELEFAVFCIENIAECLEISGEDVYRLLTVDSNALYDYIVPSYESLHTQCKEYIINDIIEYLTLKELIK